MVEYAKHIYIEDVMTHMTGKQKIYFLLDAINDAKELAPSGQPLIIDPTNDLNRNYRDIELQQLFTKLEKDEQILKVLQIPSRLQMIEIVDDPWEEQPTPEHNDGNYHIELLPTFDDYFLKIQNEQEYQKFTGRTPTNVESAKIDDPQRAYEYLTLSSLAMNLLEQAEITS